MYDTRLTELRKNNWKLHISEQYPYKSPDNEEGHQTMKYMYMYTGQLIFKFKKTKIKL